MKAVSSHTHRAFSLIELLFVIAIISLLAALLFPVFAKAREQARSATCLSNLRQIGMSLQLYLEDYDETYPMNRLPDATHAMQGCALTGSSSYPLSNLEDSSLNWRRVIQPYLKSRQVQVCSSNPYADHAPIAGIIPGDQTNPYYQPKDYLPLSYAYNGNFFHEAIPACLYGEKLERPRSLPEISSSSNLILLLESRWAMPDLGSWAMSFGPDPLGNGAFQSHTGMLNFLFADTHAKRLKYAAACGAKMWSDQFQDTPDSCQNLDRLPEEYR